jgi:hypothetical protein
MENITEYYRILNEKNSIHVFNVHVALYLSHFLLLFILVTPYTFSSPSTFTFLVDSFCIYDLGLLAWFFFVIHSLLQFSQIVENLFYNHSNIIGHRSYAKGRTRTERIGKEKEI